MKSVSFTEFRKNASTWLDLVEKGAEVEIQRHGKVIARIVPPHPPGRAFLAEAGTEAGGEDAVPVADDHRGSAVNLFADSSALAKRYIADEKSDDFDELLKRATGLSVSVLCVPEIISALCRRRRERTLTPTQYAAARRALESDLSDAAVIQITDEVLLGCVRLLETNPLRSSDAIQIASALAWHSDMFVSADARQCAAAKTSGLSVIKL